MIRRRMWLRIGVLAIAAIGVLIGLTAYFSSQKIPPCLVSGAPKWRPPTDRALHRFLVVVPDRALCFFDIDDDHHLVGYVKLEGIAGVTAVAPRGSTVALRTPKGVWTYDLVSGRVRRGGAAPLPSDTVIVIDKRRNVDYVTDRDFLGFVVERLPSGVDKYEVHFEGFTWNPRFGPNPPSHGLSLAPDRPELWVVDAPNSVVHVFDVSGVPRARPRQVTDIRLSKPLSGDENPCAHPSCRRLGSLLYSADGRFVYVGDAGDVIDAAKREQLLNLEALHQSRLMLEVDWVGGKPVFPR